MNIITNTSKTILLVEDDCILSIKEKSVLEKLGYKVIVAETGEESIKIINRDNSINMVLMDIELGDEINGIETAEIILKNHDIPIIFLSNYFDVDIVERAEKVNSYGYMIKSSNMIVVNSCIKIAFRLFEAKISEQKKDEELLASQKKLLEHQIQLEALHEKYFNLYELAPVGYLTLDENKFIIESNLFSNVIFGLNSNILNKTNIYKLIYEKDRGVYSFHYKLVNNGEFKNSCELRVIKSDGTLLWVLMSSMSMQKINSERVMHVTIEDIDDKKFIEDKIKRLLIEKDVILKEVHHRIKNNMNTICNIISFETNALNISQDIKLINILEKIQGRIYSMVVLYDKLYQAIDFNELSIKEYFDPLINDIVAIFPNCNSVKIENHIDDFFLSAKILQLLGIVINELLTNIMKHAFTDRDDGIIILSASLKDKTVLLTVQDNGKSLPESINFEKSTGFGLILVSLLVKNLKGIIKIDRNGGTKITIEFKI